MELELKLGDLINEQLTKKRWTQADLSRATKITKSGIRKIVNGDSIPKAATILKLAKALGIDPAVALKAAVDDEAGSGGNDPQQLTALDKACAELQKNTWDNDT